MKPYPELTVKCQGDRWKARVNIHVLMTARTTEDIRLFVKMYLRPMLNPDERIQVTKQILDWFTAAIAVAQENWAKASQDYVNGYKTSSEYPFQPTKKQAAANKKLLTAVEQSKKAVEKLQKRRKAFLDECLARKLEVPAN